MKIEPGYQETAGVTEQFVRAHFDYNPRQDRLIPSQDAGMPFRRGDIIKILNQEDNFWWQVRGEGGRLCSAYLSVHTLLTPPPTGNKGW